MVRELNKVRAQHGLPPLRRSASLNESSARYAHWLMTRNVFGHSTRISVASRFHYAGENLELHWGSGARAARTVQRWLGSPAHRDVMLSRDWRWVGAGRSVGTFNGRTATIWVAHFGRR